MEKLELHHMTEDEFSVYFKQAIESYANELLKSGRFPDAKKAHEFAEWEYSDIFPQGLQTPGTDVYHVYAEEKRVGLIWLLREEDTGFIGDFLIDSAYRQHGYGAKTLCLLEQEAAKAGMKKMRLGVFKNNAIARHLYEKQGYCVVRERDADLWMEKPLAD